MPGETRMRPAELLGELLALPLRALEGIFRTIVPRTLAALPEAERREIWDAIEAAQPPAVDPRRPKQLVDAFFELPPEDRRRVIEQLAPWVTGALRSEELAGYLAELREDLERLGRGDEVYDLRRPPRERPAASETRRAQTLRAFIDRVQDALVDPWPDEEATAAVATVLRYLDARITENEFRHLASQLPRDLVEVVEALGRPDVRARDLDCRTFLQRVAAETAGGDYERAQALVRAVFETLASWVSEGELSDVRRQLPHDFDPLWPPGA